MGLTKNAVFGVALGTVTLTLAVDALRFDKRHYTHTPNTHFGTIVSTSTSSLASGAAFDCVPFRAYYPQTIELLTDNVSKYSPPAPIAYVMA